MYSSIDSGANNALVGHQGVLNQVDVSFGLTNVFSAETKIGDDIPGDLSNVTGSVESLSSVGTLALPSRMTVDKWKPGTAGTARRHRPNG